MSFFVWEPKYDIGVGPMNDEHVILIDLMNKLHAANGRKAPHDELKTIFGQLVSYTRKHFADEERFLESIAFPGLATHKIIHANLLQQLGHHQTAFEASLGGVSEAVFDFLKVWLSAHIMSIDMKYGEFAKSTAARKAG